MRRQAVLSTDAAAALTRFGSKQSLQKNVQHTLRNSLFKLKVDIRHASTGLFPEIAAGVLCSTAVVSARTFLLLVCVNIWLNWLQPVLGEAELGPPNTHLTHSDLLAATGCFQETSAWGCLFYCSRLPAACV